MQVSKEEISRVKGLGFLQDKNTEDRFNARVITGNGRLSAEKLEAILQAARTYGNGDVAMTTRQTIEVQSIAYADIDAFRTMLASAGLETGGTGKKVRPVVSCKGTTCQYGLLDSYGLSAEIHERFYRGFRQETFPHKVKIAVGGCPNNCVKPNLNDIGIVGQRVPRPDPEQCRGCKTCKIEAACPIRNPHVRDGKIDMNPEGCNHCGRCVGKCPFGVTDASEDGYRIYIGGRWGKKTAMGRPLERMFRSREEVLRAVERILRFYQTQGVDGERFADTIARIGFETVQEEILREI